MNAKARDEKRRVGLLLVKEAKDVLRTFEYAGSGEIWDLEEALIPIYADRESGGYWITGDRPGILKESWFQDRIGSCLGSDNRDKSHRRGFYPFQFDTFYVGRLVHEGRVLLEESWENVLVGTYTDGRPMFQVQKRNDL